MDMSTVSGKDFSGLPVIGQSAGASWSGSNQELPCGERGPLLGAEIAGTGLAGSCAAGA